ncbi:monogalactosyldiacylglycerol synthase [Hydrogenispora ethanolica]|uniref:Monogalactosyldiacylglycerol synthase n=1 Tax=Hydrogenispora ethanolica TaxID=1082276 RepID=A0A4R1R8P5_HYDET|nr:glycosyltransferase [Hydrogenispora ethanolica]TCL62026.1 monogalactosyldiacylglycerol synthase [Hydrogenispora ethanolica]
MGKERCDILILSASYGGGHNQVARALTQALHMQAPGLRIITVDYCDLLFPLLNRFTQFSYNQSIRHFPVGYALYYQATGKISPDSFWQRRLNRMGYSELIMLVGRLEPRVIVSTFPIPAGVLSEMKEAGDLNVPVVTVITDICVHSQWIHPHTDLYLVGSGEVAKGLEERGIPRANIAVTGIPILPTYTRTVDREQVKRDLGYHPEDRLILFMGGNNGVFGTTQFHHLLRDLPPNIKALVLTGSNHELYEKLLPTAAKHRNIRICKYVDNTADLMSAADLLVTKAGGITISEALAKGLPMIIYKPTPGHEEANANYLWRHRAAIVAKSERRLKMAIGRLITDEAFRDHIRKNCLKNGTPDSALIGAKLVLNLLTPRARGTRYLKMTARREIRA